MSAFYYEDMGGNPGYDSGSQQSPTASSSSGGPSVSSALAKDGRNAELKELRSDDGRFKFVVEDSGSLVLYMGPDAIWAIYSDAPSSPRSSKLTKLVLQSDGNLVVLHGSHGLIWSSDTGGCAPGPFRLALHNDGNCVLYDGMGTTRWSTRTRGWG